jgi:putative membrane protein
MFHFYDGYHFLGMHLLWWVFWILFIVLVFGSFTPLRWTIDRKGARP